MGVGGEVVQAMFGKTFVWVQRPLHDLFLRETLDHTSNFILPGPLLPYVAQLKNMQMI